MKLFLQFGHGMIAHCDHLLSANTGAGVILSPRDLSLEQLLNVAQKSQKSGKAVLFDPQCYVRDADHPRLTQHPYWTFVKGMSTNNLLTAGGAEKIIGALKVYNHVLNSESVILPALMADSVTREWLTVHGNIASEGARQITDRPVLSSIALSADAIMDEAQIEAVVEEVARWNVSGFYVVAQAPKYLVEDINWLANLLILASGLRLLDKKVIVGYGNHQLLSLAAANVDAIASGTWLNVRAFDPSKFYIPDEGEISRRTTWYYCPQALSEYKITFLDAAHRAGILQDLRPDTILGSTFADPLFAGAKPSSVNWGEPAAFPHYLTCLNGQIAQSRKSTFDATVEYHRLLLDNAEVCLKHFSKHGVLGGDRDFRPILDINRSAITMLTHARGTQLRRNW